MPTIQLTAGSLMSTQVPTIPPDERIADAARLMAECGVGALPVVADGTPLGMLTDRDIVVRALACDHVNPATCTVERIMTGELICVHVEDELPQVAELMATRRVRRLGVCDDSGEIVGLIGLDDLIARGGDTALATRTLSRIRLRGRG